MVFHKHHIVPKYAGGTDDPSNLVTVNVTMHAFLHELRYIEHGDKRDLLAAQGLRGIVGKEEIWKHLSSLSRRFSGKEHNPGSKKRISQSLLKAWKHRSKEQIAELGRTSKHLRNNLPGRQAAAQTGHPHKRKHWTKEVFEEVKNAYLSRTSYHWGRKEICQKYGLSSKTVENMVKHIQEGKTFEELMAKRGELK